MSFKLTFKFLKKDEKLILHNKLESYMSDYVSLYQILQLINPLIAGDVKLLI